MLAKAMSRNVIKLIHDFVSYIILLRYKNTTRKNQGKNYRSFAPRLRIVERRWLVGDLVVDNGRV